MIYLCYVLLVIGVVAYGSALFYMDHALGETFSDVGNAAMLLATVLLLLRLSHKTARQSAPQG